MGNNNEIKIFFTMDGEQHEDFLKAVKKKSKQLGIPLNKKQAYMLALKEIAKIWNEKAPLE